MPREPAVATAATNEEKDGDVRTHYAVKSSLLSPALISELAIRTFAGAPVNGAETTFISKTGLDKLKKAGWDVSKEFSTEYEGVMYIDAKAPGSETDLDVRFVTWDGEYDKDVLTNQIRTAFGHLKHPVDVYVPHGYRADPQYGARLSVFFWSTPDRRRNQAIETPGRMWGHKVDIQDGSAFGMWEDGLPIITDEGQTVAAIDHRNLYIYHDACHQDSATSRAIIERIFADAAKCLKLDQAGNMILVQDIIADRNRARYVELCMARVKTQLARADQDLSGFKSTIEQSQRAIVDAHRSMMDAMRNHDILTKNVHAGREKFISEYDSFMKIPLLTQVRIEGQNVIFFTDSITVTDPRTKRKHEIGKFKVIMTAQGGHARMHNQTRQISGYRGGMMHPHVFADGTPCLGTLESSLPRTLSNMEYAIAAQLVMAYLTSVNVNDGAGEYVNRWPIVFDNGKVETEAHRAKRVEKIMRGEADEFDAQYGSGDSEEDTEE